MVQKSVSIIGFLERVMEEGNGDVEVILGCLVITVRAVFLEPGFVVSGGNGSRLPVGWASAAHAEVSILYIVPP